MLLPLLEMAANRALESDPASERKLKKLQDKTLALVIKNSPITLLLTPTQTGLEFELASEDAQTTPDVTLSTTINALIKISRDGLEDAELAPGELNIEGDAITGQRFAGIISSLDIDWQELLSHHIGDSPTQLVSVAVSKAKEQFSDAQNDIKSIISGLLKDDLALTASPAETDKFLDDVDTLRGDSDRLMSRINNLQSHIDQSIENKSE